MRMQAPLKGIRVVDFSWMLAGPYTTRAMADFGAEVIKVQSALVAGGMEQNDSPLFAVVNRNKLGITLNMNKPEAMYIMLKLLAISDIMVQNFSPRVLQNWGLTYAAIKKINPSLIMLNLSGFGNTGPWRGHAALADTIEALSGLSYLSSAAPDSGEIIPYPYADIISGMYSLIAVLSALEERRKTGRGKCIDISEFEAMCSLLGPTVLHYAANGERPNPWSAKTDKYSPFQGCYRCKGEDRWIVLSINDEEQWRRLNEIMGNPSWFKNLKYSTMGKCKQHKAQVDKYIQRWSVKQQAEVLIRQLSRAKIPCSMVNNASDLALDPQLRQRNYYITSKHAKLGTVSMENTALRLGRTPAALRKAAPLLGEDNYYVFQSLLGMDGETLERYRKMRIIY